MGKQWHSVEDQISRSADLLPKGRTVVACPQGAPARSEETRVKSLQSTQDRGVGRWEGSFAHRPLISSHFQLVALIYSLSQGFQAEGETAGHYGWSVPSPRPLWWGFTFSSRMEMSTEVCTSTSLIPTQPESNGAS